MGDKNELSYVSKRRQGCLSIISHQNKHHNESYNYENNNKYMQKSKIQLKSARRKCRSHLDHKSFSENLVYDALVIFYETMGSINIGILW